MEKQHLQLINSFLFLYSPFSSLFLLLISFVPSSTHSVSWKRRNANFCKPLPEKVPLLPGRKENDGKRKSSPALPRSLSLSLPPLPPPILFLRGLLISARAIESNVKKVVGNWGREERRERLPIWRRTRGRNNRAKIPPFLVFPYCQPPNLFRLPLIRQRH